MSNTISLEQWEAKRGQKKRRNRSNGGGGTEGPDTEAESKFSLTTNGGLFRRVGTAEPPKWEHVAQAFEILGCVRDSANARGERDGWGRLIRFTNRDGADRDVMVSDAELHSDAGKLAATLADKGMAIEGTLTARRALAEYLLSAVAEKRVTVVRGVGWRDVGDSAFMLTNETIIKGQEVMEPIILASHIRAPYESQGTLKDWREGAGRLAKGHRLATLAISTALASTLLHVAGYESGGVHAYGRSSIGKTSSLRLAASVWGRGAEGGNLRSWRSTANALEATLAGACDVGLVIDEIGQIDGRELGAVLYMAANGVGKQRMGADASLRDAYTWRLLVLSSGEDPIEAKLNEDKNRNVRAGQLARMLDVPVSRDNGAFGEILTEFDGGAFAAECMRAATTAYGTVGPEFVRRLFASSRTPGVSGARDETRNAVDAFVSKIGLRLDGQTLRAAQRFGLIAFAGELAIENGLVPWELGSAAEAARWAFDRWLEARGGVIPYEASRAVGGVRHFLEAHGDSRFEDLDQPSDPDRRPTVNRAGFREGKGESRRWYAYPEVWRTEICAGLDPHDVAKTLADLGMLDPGADKLAKPKKVGGKTQRFYTLKPEIFDGWGEQE